MKRFRQILAMTGIVILVAMYALTLVFALTDNPNTMGFFKASIACTIFIPVVLYAFLLFHRLGHNKDSFPENEEKEDNE